MDERAHCGGCGAERPADAPGGLCPACLVRAGLGGGDASGRHDLGFTIGPATPGVFESLAETIDDAPRVSLRGTDAGDGPGAATAPAPPDGVDPAGRLRLFGEIARGGMGAVLRGRDADLGRDLAVKVLLDQHRHRPEMVRRFVEEAQIGGQLQHPGIVPVYELGAFVDRRPYFTMKLVKGRTLAELLRGRAGPGEDRPRLLGIFEQVCQTVAYAHARGVIHRDLKPANVMVGSFGEVQVMDWGLAKVLPEGGAADETRGVADDAGAVLTVRSGSDADASQAGSVLGTPAYMAPEQARGEVDRVDERADVFGLGAILCEVLTGAAPYTARTAEAVCRKAARADLAEARSRLDSSGAEPELLRLAADCLAAEPEGRPRDAGVVAGRLTSYLAGVQERLRAAELARAEAQARAAAERARRRLAVALAASVLAAAVLVGGGWAWVSRQRAGRVAATARAVDRALDEATRLGGEARGAPAFDPARWGEALAAARRAEAVLAQGEGDAETRGRVRGVLAKLTRERDEAKARAEAAAADRRLVERLGEIRNDLGLAPDREKAEADFAAAFRAAGFDLDALPTAEAGARIAARPVGVELAAALDIWAFNRLMQRSWTSEAAAGRLLAIAKLADPDPWRNRLRDALGLYSYNEDTFRQLAASADVASLPAESVRCLAEVLSETRNDAAAAALLRQLQPRRRDDFWVNADLGVSLNRLRQADEAIRYYTAALAIRPRSRIALRGLGDALGAAGRRDEAIDVLRELTRLNPDDVPSHDRLGAVLQKAGRRDEAVAEFRTALRLQPGDHTARTSLIKLIGLGETVTLLREALLLKPDDATGHAFFGGFLFGEGRHDEAVAEFRIAVRLSPEVGGANFRVLAALVGHDEAIANFREALRLKPDDAEGHHVFGLILWQLGYRDEAVAEIGAAIRHRHGDAKAGLYVQNLEALGHADAAIVPCREAVRERPGNPVAHHILGIALLGAGRNIEAIDSFRTALLLAPDSVTIRTYLGDALIKTGKTDEAIARLREVAHLAPGLASARLGLGDALVMAGRAEEAIAEYRDGLRLFPGGSGLFAALEALGRHAECVDALRDALRHHPDDPAAHYQLGLAERDRGHLNEALAEFRRAGELYGPAAQSWPTAEERAGRIRDLAARGARVLQYWFLLARGSEGGFRLGDGLVALLRAAPHRAAPHRTAGESSWATPTGAGMPEAMARCRRDTERLIGLAARLPAVLRGDDRPTDEIELLDFARVGYFERMYAHSTRFYEEAFAALPSLADDPKSGLRYDAACSAALGGGGQGGDDPPPDEAARAGLRRKALGWLRADLAARADQAKDDSLAIRVRASQKLLRRKGDPDLGCVRDPAALARLPESERKEWESLWSNVDALLAKARGGRP